jgi:hypothetical protein
VVGDTGKVQIQLHDSSGFYIFHVVLWQTVTFCGYEYRALQLYLVDSVYSFGVCFSVV